MRIQMGFLQSKVARRIFVLFVLAALLPILLTSYLSYQQVRSLIEKERFSQLNLESKQLSMVTYERMLNIEYRLQALPSSIDFDSFVDPAPLFSTFANSADLVDIETKSVTNVYGVSSSYDVAQMIEASSNNRWAILSLPQPVEEKYSIYLIERALVDDKENHLLVLNLKSDYLWPPEHASYGIYGVVYSIGGDLLYQAPELGNNFQSDILFEAITQQKQNLVWSGQREKYLVSARSLFLEGDFQASDWIFVSIQPMSFSLEEVYKFARHFIPPIALALCLISIVSLMMIRRNLVPIDKLLEGTHKIGEKDLTHQILIEGDDEFSKLADSFNHMTSTLKVQFDRYDYLSEVDQLILQDESADNVFKTVLRGLLRIASADCAFLIRTQEKNCELIFTLASDSPVSAYSVDMALDPLLSLEWTETGRSSAESEWLQLLEQYSSLKNCCYHSFALVEEGRAYGAVVVANNGSKRYTTEEYSIIRDYAFRIAIAITALTHREQLLQFATVDSLTNIPNRREMRTLTSTVVAQAKQSGGCGSFLFVDLDRFKIVNDAHGHQVGDCLLVEVANRLTKCISEECTVSRFGGDEFAVLVPNANGIEAVEILAANIIETISRRYVINELEMYVGASVGIAMFPSHGSGFDELLQNADIAMYKAKNSERGSYFIYSESLRKERLTRSEMETDIREALKNNEFELHYQPKVEAGTGLVKGFEALLRWQHKTKGYISPFQVVSIAEESGLILELDDWVFNQACTEIAKWQKLMPQPLTFSINVSAKRLMDNDFIPAIKRTLSRTSVAPEVLEIELTESVFMDDQNAALKVLDKIHQLGIRVALDDFGTGYSSLSYLSGLPIDTLKIDRAFVNGIGQSGREEAIVHAVIALARVLHMDIVAEGVETDRQVAFLNTHAGGQFQGYFFSKPLPVDQAQVLVENPKAFVDKFLLASGS